MTRCRLDRLPNEEEVLAIAEKWRPFRSLATSYLFATRFQTQTGRSVTRRDFLGQGTRDPHAPEHVDNG